MSTSLLPDDAELRRLYIEEKLTMPKIAQMFGVSRQRVHQRFKEAGIERHPNLSLDRTTLVKLYVQQELKPEQIAEILGVYASLVRSQLKRHEIPLRPRHVHRLDRDTLYKLYVTDGLLMREIGERFGCSQNTVSVAIIRHGIKERHRPSGRRTVPFTRDQLHSLYIDQRLSSPKIAKLLGGHDANVRYWLKRYGIPLRNSGNMIRNYDERPMQELYLTKKMPITVIAAKLGVSVSFVYTRLRRSGILIPRKPKG